MGHICDSLPWPRARSGGPAMLDASQAAGDPRVRPSAGPRAGWPGPRQAVPPGCHGDGPPAASTGTPTMRQHRRRPLSWRSAHPRATQMCPIKRICLAFWLRRPEFAFLDSARPGATPNVSHRKESCLGYRPIFRDAAMSRSSSVRSISRFAAIRDRRAHPDPYAIDAGTPVAAPGRGAGVSRSAGEKSLPFFRWRSSACRRFWIIQTIWRACIFSPALRLPP